MTAQILSDLKTEMLQHLEQSHARMKAALDEVGEHRELYPSWQAKQLLDHLTAWDETCVTSLRAHAEGREIIATAQPGGNDFNAQSVAARAGLDFDASYRDWETARAAFIATIRDMPNDLLTAPMLYPWGQTGPAGQLACLMAGHESQHVEEIAALITDIT